VEDALALGDPALAEIDHDTVLEKAAKDGWPQGARRTGRFTSHAPLVTVQSCKNVTPRGQSREKQSEIRSLSSSMQAANGDNR
jgi:hypothetical protein